MLSIQQVILLSVLCVVLSMALLRWKDTPRRHLPPGPSQVFALRNILAIDIRQPWKMLQKLNRQYGPIFYLRLWNQGLIIISSDKVAQELFGKRSQNCSSRPAFVVSMAQLMGIDYLSPTLPYGNHWRLHSQFFHQAFHRTATPSFRPIQLRRTHDLMVCLLSTPRDFASHFHLFGAAVIVAAVYGYDVAGFDDPILARFQHMTKFLEDISRIKTIVIFPFLKHVPEWFPGSKFRRDALTLRRLATSLKNVPFEYVKKGMAAGTAPSCMASGALLKIQAAAKTEADTASLEEYLKEACVAAFSAAAETTCHTLMIFVLAMILYPEVQARAQAEIDSVIGNGLPRLPNWEDRSSLPYVEAVVKEALRWHPTAPLGLPHATVDDDIYEGYHIPRGATVVVNAWAVARDPAQFPDPDKFKPERFLHENSPAVDELSFAFGYGRRVCPGRYFADGSLWISIVSLLSVFRFEALPSWDPGLNGVHVKWAEGGSTYPEELSCEIKPRHKNFSTEKLADLIKLATS